MSYEKYFRDVKHLDKIDIYRFLDLFGVTDHALGHAIKKLVLAGVRTGGKPSFKDISEARDTLNRKLEMMQEDDGWNNEAIKAAAFTENNILLEDGWIKYDGKGRPVKSDKVVDLMYENGNLFTNEEAGGVDWDGDRIEYWKPSVN